MFRVLCVVYPIYRALEIKKFMLDHNLAQNIKHTSYAIEGDFVAFAGPTEKQVEAIKTIQKICDCMIYVQYG